MSHAVWGTEKSSQAHHQHSLTNALKDLEADELVQRIQYNEIPLRVEYSLTLKGQDLLPVFYAIMQWGINISLEFLKQMISKNYWCIYP